MGEMTEGRIKVLGYLSRRSDFDACPASSEISYGLRRQYRDWADSKLKALLAKGLVEVAGSTFSNARTWRITDAGRAALAETLDDEERKRVEIREWLREDSDDTHNARTAEDRSHD